jgi:hypothetical protein
MTTNFNLKAIRSRAKDPTLGTTPANPIDSRGGLAEPEYFAGQWHLREVTRLMLPQMALDFGKRMLLPYHSMASEVRPVVVTSNEGTYTRVKMRILFKVRDDYQQPFAEVAADLINYE